MPRFMMDGNHDLESVVEAVYHQGCRGSKEVLMSVVAHTIAELLVRLAPGEIEEQAMQLGTACWNMAHAAENRALI